MSSEELMSKSPFVFGRFEWNTTEYPPAATQIPEGGWSITEIKFLKIIGHDESHNINACSFEFHRANMNDPRHLGLAFYINKAIKGKVHIEMKMSIKNVKKLKTFI